MLLPPLDKMGFVISGGMHTTVLEDEYVDTVDDLKTGNWLAS